MDRETLYIQQVIDGDVNRFAYFVEQYQDMAFVTASGILGNGEDAILSQELRLEKNNI